MKTLFTFVLCASLTAVVAQTKAPAPTPAPAPTVQTAPTLTAKQKTLVNTWTFDRSESFDLVQKPTEAQKNDLLNLQEGGRYRLILDGVAEGGTWTVDAGCKWITLTKDDGSVKKFQVLSQTDKELKVDYRDGDGTHNVLIYVPATTSPAAPTKR